jgi:type IV secretory pathway VirB10-like protein
VEQQNSPNQQKPIDSPTGIDLNPEPPSTVRVSKRAGFAAISALAGVGALFGYGIYERHAKQVQAALHTDDHEKVQPAENAAREITKNIPAGTITASRNAAQRNDVPDLDNPNKVESKPDEHNAQPSQPVRAVRTAPPQLVQSASVQQPAEPSPEEKRLIAAYQREMQAIAAPTTIQTGSGNQTGAPSAFPAIAQTPTSAPPLDDIQRMLKGIIGPGASATASAQNNSQSEKDGFLAHARGSKTDDYLNSTRTPPVSKYEIKAGWDIPAVLEQALNSDLPGEIRALVTENVYDPATGRYLLIPQGSRLVGTYDSHIGYGQNGVQIVWDRIIFPDASSIDLEGMVGQDASGASGLRGKVDNHMKRLVGYSILSSVITAGFELTQSRSNRALLQYPSVGDTAEGAVGQELGRVGSQLTQRQMNIQPTIKIPVGLKFNVRVDRDIIFDGPFLGRQVSLLRNGYVRSYVFS